MRRGSILLITAVLLLCPLTALSQSADVSGSEPNVASGAPLSNPVATVTIYGYVSNVSDRVGNIPFSGVSVTILDGITREPLDIENPVCMTDSEGKFEFTYTSGVDILLVFEYQGYNIRSLPESLSIVEGSITSVDLSLAQIDSSGKYRLTDKGDLTHSIGMGITTGVLRGTAYGLMDDEQVAISGATVVAVSEHTGRAYQTTTDSMGYFELDVPYDTYIVTASCRGFTDSEPLRMDTSDSTLASVVLKQNEFGIGFMGGLDLTHGFMVVALGLIAALILVIGLLIVRSKSTDATISVVEMTDPDDSDDGFNRF